MERRSPFSPISGDPLHTRLNGIKIYKLKTSWNKSSRKGEGTGSSGKGKTIRSEPFLWVNTRLYVPIASLYAHTECSPCRPEICFAAVISSPAVLYWAARPAQHEAGCGRGSRQRSQAPLCPTVTPSHSARMCRAPWTWGGRAQHNRCAGSTGAGLRFAASLHSSSPSPTPRRSMSSTATAPAWTLPLVPHSARRGWGAGRSVQPHLQPC